MLSNFYKLFRFTFYITMSLYTSVWLLSPWVANHFLGEYLENQSLSLSDETSIRYNPFRSRLEINDLRVDNANDAEQVLALTFLSFELHLHQLIFEDIYIPQVVIKGLDLAIEKQEAEVVIAGISLATNAEDSQTNVSEKNPSSEVTAETISEGGNKEGILSFLNRLVMPKLLLESSIVRLSIGENQHQVVLHNVEINDLLVADNKQVANLNIKSELDEGLVEIAVSIELLDEQGGIDVDVNISNVAVERFSYLLPEGIDSIKGVVNYQGSQRFVLENDSLIMNVKTGQFGNSDLNIGTKDTHISIAQQDIKFTDIVVVLEKHQPPKIKGDSVLLIQNLTVYNQEKEKVIANIKQLNLPSIHLFNDGQGIQKINIDKVSLLNAHFSDNHNDSIPALVQFTELTLQNIGLSQYGIDVENINLAGLSVNAELDNNKQLINLVAITNNKETTAPADELSEESVLQSNPSDLAGDDQELEVNPTFKIKLKSFNLNGEAEMYFTDNSVSPIYQRKVSIDELIAGPFDSENPQQKSIITLAGRSNRYSTFSFVTNAKPFLENPSYKIEGNFKELSLPGLSSYIKQALQYEIESGQLDLAVDVQLTGSEIAGEVQVMLRGIELTAADVYETSSISDQTSIPFNMALGMLKDSEGNVELNLPITGDTNSPNFGLSGFLTLLVKQATILGARDYLVNAFVPYAQVVNIAVLAGDYALKVRINDLPYASKNIILQPEQEEFLQQFSALLKDKESTQVKLCAIATASDIDKKAGSDLTNPDDLVLLNKISMQRVNTFKDYMIEKENIDSSRLLLCTPKVDSNIDAISRISFET